jgi:hypothetical protein
MPISLVLIRSFSVTAVSVARLVIYHWRFSPNNKDRTYGTGYCISSVEINLAIATACVPPLRPLARRIAPRLLGSDNRSKPGYRQTPEDNGQYELGTKMTGWKGSQHRVEAWSSNEQILAEPEEIRRTTNVELTFGEATSLDDKPS